MTRILAAIVVVLVLAIASSASAQFLTPLPTLTPLVPPIYAPVLPPILASGAPRIVAQDGTYLGKLSLDRFDPESISNRFGDYGSRFSQTSIANPFSDYGNRFSGLSATNPFATAPPIVVSPNGMRLGVLSANPFASLSPFEGGVGVLTLIAPMGMSPSNAPVGAWIKDKQARAAYQAYLQSLRK